MIGIILEEGVKMPKYESEGAAAFDVIAHDILKIYKGDEEVTGERFDAVRQSFLERGSVKMRPFERILFHTGLSAGYMPKRVKLTVKDRSGISLKRGLKVFNSPGTIDSDYRGPIGVIIQNSNPHLVEIFHKERIAQIETELVVKVDLVPTTKTVPTARGAGGFASTGNF